MFAKVIKNFILVLKEPTLTLKLLKSIKKYGIKYTIKKVLYPYSPLSHKNNVEINVSQGEKVYILTTSHCYFIANLLRINLGKLNIKADIIYRKPAGGFSNGLHFVISPQMFNEFPEHYVAFQLEQSVSSRWFNDEYFSKLKNAYAVLDYSLSNISFLQKNGLMYQQVYFMPLFYQENYNDNNGCDEVYDVLFYGDVKNPRRKKCLDVISKKFKTKIVKNLFADDLYVEIKKAKVIINIHYYDNALLETTRLYECLSLNKLIISERSADLSTYEDIEKTVDFVDVGDIEQMCNRISYWLEDDERRKIKIKNNINYLQQSSNVFEYYFMRFMLANDWITFDEFYKLAGHNIKLSNDFICLSLPESIERNQQFSLQNHFNIQMFPGLRHQQGWLGCGMSYKFILQKAKETGLDMVTICEDDVEFYQNFWEQYLKVKCFLTTEQRWDLFSGLIADVSERLNILETKSDENQEYIFVDKMTSMVFNIYSHRFYDKLLSWNEKNIDVESNTIDRYIESHSNCVTVTILPYLVGHKDNLKSTLWGISNDLYSEMIKNSERKLFRKVKHYKDNQKNV